MLKTILYIDGFNLYYSLLKRNPQHRWLNPFILSQKILADNNHIHRINFYTARISSKLDAHAPAHQKTYLNALETIPEMAIHYGKFQVSRKWLRLATPHNTEKCAEILAPEEKGSDVNLASHLLRDSFQNNFDVAVVITNDTDLVEPIRIATQELEKTVGLISPVNRPAESLLDVASFHKYIRTSDLNQSQFPDKILGTTLSRPNHWKKALNDTN